MTDKEKRKKIAELVKGAAPTCSYQDGQPDRFRVWLENPARIIKARSKTELREKLNQDLFLS